MITNALTTRYDRPAPYKAGAEAWGLWDRRNRHYDGMATPCIVMTPHNFGPEAYYAAASEEMRELADKGFVVACPYPDSPVEGRTFGNDDAIDSMAQCRAWMIANLGCRSDKVALFGMSMGGLAVCNYARTLSAGSVLGIAFCCGATDLQSVHDINGTYSTEVDAAYTDHAGFLAAKPTHSPVQFAAADLAGIPCRHWYSTDDTMVTPTTVTNFSTAQGSTTNVSLGAIGHNPSGADGADVAAWLVSLL